MRQVSKLMRGQRPTSQVSVMVAILTVLVLLISFCAYRWKRQYAGLGKGRTTFLVSFAIVIAYNVIRCGSGDQSRRRFPPKSHFPRMPVYQEISKIGNKSNADQSSLVTSGPSAKSAKRIS